MFRAHRRAHPAFAELLGDLVVLSRPHRAAKDLLLAERRLKVLLIGDTEESAERPHAQPKVNATN